MDGMIVRGYRSNEEIQVLFNILKFRIIKFIIVLDDGAAGYCDDLHQNNKLRNIFFSLIHFTVFVVCNSDLNATFYFIYFFRMYKREQKEWQNAIIRYDRIASKLFKKIKLSLKKKQLSKEESKLLVQTFGKKICFILF